MSVDFHVYVSRAASDAELAELISGIAGLEVEDQRPGGGATVVRGAGKSYCCTVEDPLRVDNEDVPAEVAAVTLAASVLYEVLVEGSATASVAPAQRVARGLAKLLDGAVYDPQTDEVWSTKAGRVVAAPQRDERVGVINVDWCFANDRVDGHAVRAFLALCRRHLPESLPRRYGDFEPMQHRFEHGGEDAFVQFWSSGTDVDWNAKLPCADGHLMEPPGRGPSEGPAWYASLTFLQSAFDASDAWRTALRGLFVSVAEELGAFYACAQASAGYIWARGGLWSDQDTESGAQVGGYWWRGVPAHPMWWNWYGPEYAPIVKALLVGAHNLTETATGLFHACSELPRTCRELRAEQVVWLPDELTAESGRRPARRIPAALEFLAGKRSDDDTDYWRHDPQERARIERRARLDAAGQLVVDDLRSAGVEVTDLRQLSNKLLRKPATVRVLADQLDRDLPWQVKQDVVSRLADARGAAVDLWPDLRSRFLSCAPDDKLKFSFAVAVANTAGNQWLAELIELVEDPRHARYRDSWVTTLKRSKDPRAVAALQRLHPD